MIKKHWEKILVTILTLPFVYLAYLYFINDSLAVYDAPGHVNLIWYLKQYLWPNFTGWNSFNLLGFDQGRFYPPLFHYLSATLSFFFGIDNSTKLVIILALISLPASIYYFLVVVFKDVRERVLVTGIILLLLTLAPGYLGANIKGLFQVGLLPSFVSSPILFFYFASLLRLKKIGWLVPSLLLAALILTHMVAAFIAIIFLLATIISEKINLKSIRDYLIHFGLTLLLTTFFWLPFLVQSSQLSTSVHLSSLGMINGAIIVISLGFVVYLLKKRNQVLLSISLVSLFLSSLTTFDYFIERVLSDGFIYEKIYNLHLYRLQIYEFILVVILVSYYPVVRLYRTLGKVKSRLYFVALIPIVTVSLIFVLRSPALVKKVTMTNFNRDKVNGRFLETFSRSQTQPFVYTEQTNLVIQKKQPWAYGLFTDANQNGPFLSSLIRSLNPDPEAYSKTKTKFIEETTIDKSRLRDVINLFAINNFLQTNFFVDQRSDGLDLISVTAFKQNLVQVVNSKIKVIDKNWQNQVQKWWLEKGKMEEILVRSKQNKTNLIKTNLESNPKIEIVKHNESWTSFTLDLKSKYRQPILVKISYSPNWHAYQDNKSLPIYQASPSLMLVYGSGKIDFKYQTLWYQYLAGAISLLTIFGLASYRLRRRH